MFFLFIFAENNIQLSTGKQFDFMQWWPVFVNDQRNTGTLDSSPKPAVTFQSHTLFYKHNAFFLVRY